MMNIVKQSGKEYAIAECTGAMDDKILRGIMYDAVEKVNVMDNQNVEIVWKFKDLFQTA